MHDFLKKYVAASGNICYFNYAYSGERVGRALLGIEFADATVRTAFLAALPDRGTGFRACRVVKGPVGERLGG